MTAQTDGMCFVLMPFSPRFKNQWELAFCPAIQAAGLVPFRGDEQRLGTNIIMRDVTRCIFEAKIIVADLTDRNPNVMYELGLAHSAKKPVIMLAQDELDVPFDVRHVRYLKYDEKDLTRLKAELQDRIIHTLRMDLGQQPDYFPELIPMNADHARELRYLQAKAPDLTIETFPPTADIFFNDQLLGPSPQTVKVNPDAPANWISVSGVEYFEYHGELDRAQASSGRLGIVLQARDPALLARRVAGYLRERRKYPYNPVLMRAIATYLWTVGERDEALTESRELLRVAPHWAHSHSTFGFVLPDTDDHYPEKLQCYRTSHAIQKSNFIGVYNQACVYSLMGAGDDSNAQLELIRDDEEMLLSYCFLPESLVAVDSDFNLMRKSEHYGPRFKTVEEELTRQWRQFEPKRNAERARVEALNRPSASAVIAPQSIARTD